MKKLIVSALALSLGACFPVEETPPGPSLTGFEVKLVGVFLANDEPDVAPDIAAPVVPLCSDQYPGGVPAGLLGSVNCRFAISKGDLDFVVEITAVGADGQPATDLTRPVSFRVLPGDLTSAYKYRWAQITNGVGTARVRANHIYGVARVWVEDAPPQPLYDGAGALITVDGFEVGLPNEAALEFPRTFATGLSKEIYFEEPTLAKLQEPDVADNRSSPFVGQFVNVGRAPTAGPQVVHNCAADPAHNGQEVAMVVTGIDASGFFLTDINSCRIPEVLPNTTPSQIAEGDGYLPGTFGSIYVYNYSHPDGLDVGDLLFAVSGSMQEFTSTTQLTFAAWNIKDKVRLRPVDQWNVWLDQVPVVDFNLRTCGLATTPFITDTLCAHNTRSMKVESLESTLVRMEHVKLPNAFAPCDRNADGEVEFFCNYRDDATNDQLWGICPFGPPTGPLAEEIQCYIDCTNSLGQYNEKVCTERTAFANFAQVTVELAGIGPAAAGLDDSLGAGVRVSQVTTDAAASRSPAFKAGNQVSLFCNAPVHYKIGNSAVTATNGDVLLAANTLAEPFIHVGETHVSVLSADPAVTATCSMSVNPRTRALTVLKDVAPDLVLECDPNGSTPEAEQCRFLQAATFDIVGHVRQVQPARPRWMIIPRDLDDVCCHPGPGMQCPTPIAACQP